MRRFLGYMMLELYTDMGLGRLDKHSSQASGYILGIQVWKAWKARRTWSYPTVESVSLAVALNVRINISDREEPKSAVACSPLSRRPQRRHEGGIWARNSQAEHIRRDRGCHLSWSAVGG